MLSNGTRTECSDARDATGDYIWRENGARDGRCCGIDFEQAKRKRDAKECNDEDFVCGVTKLSGYVPYAYDAAIALAHGLHKLVNEGFDLANMTAGPLSRAIRESPFKGATGWVSFEENGDRRSNDVEYDVYNYQLKGDGSHGFEDVGSMINGSFVRCQGDKCRPMMFSDGTPHPPNVQRTVRETQRRVFVRALGYRLSERLD